MARARHPSSPLLTLVAIVVAIAALHLARDILLPLSLAILISFLLTPVANRLERWRLGRILSVVIAVGGLFSMLGVIGWIVKAQIVELSDQLPNYGQRIVDKARDVIPESGMLTHITETVEKVEAELTKDVEAKDSEKPSDENGETPGAATAATVESSESLQESMSELIWGKKAKSAPIDVRVVSMAPSPLSQIREWLGPVLSPFATAGITLVLVIFILLKREDQRNRLLQLFGSSHLHASTEALTDVTERVSQYLRMQFLINAGYGICVGVGLTLIGVPGGVMWGVLSFSLRFLPYIGPWLSAIMPIVVSLGNADGWNQPLMVVGWFIILELIVNNVAEPLLYGRSTGVSGVGVIVAAMFWTWVWGPIGLVLAMPLTVCVVVLARYVPGLKFLAVLLGDQPTLSDEERVYQRLLIGDDEEGKQLALSRLKNSSLAEVYDTILIPALSLAERDRHAGRLSEDQEEIIQETARDLVEELGETARMKLQQSRQETPLDATAAAPPTPLRVLCIPLRDDADDTSALMLKQLLVIEGIDVEVAAVEALTGELVESIATLKIDVAFVSILPPLPPRSSRLLCRRLRERYPTLPIVVGYWCGDCPEELQRRLSGDGETLTTLAAAVERIRAIAARPRVATKKALATGWSPTP